MTDQEINAVIAGLCEHFGAQGIVDLSVKLLRLERERNEAREALDDIAEYGTEEINAAVDLRSELAAALVERDDAIAARKASAADWLNQICQANARVSRAFRERNEALAAIVGWEIKWKCAVEMAAQAEVERDEALEDLENHKAESIHTCHYNCKRPMCVLRSERDEARAQLDAERALADRLAQFIGLITDALGPYQYLNGTLIVRDAYHTLAAWKEARKS